MRINRRQLYLEMALLMSKRGTCDRAQVGCIITSMDHRIISSGYNGPLKENCTSYICADGPCQRAMHAEANAIVAAAKHGVSLNGGIIYCTHSPCYKCAEMIVQVGISEAHWIEEYRIKDGIYLLKNSNIIIHEQTEDYSEQK